MAISQDGRKNPCDNVLYRRATESLNWSIDVGNTTDVLAEQLFLSIPSSSSRSMMISIGAFQGMDGLLGVAGMTIVDHETSFPICLAPVSRGESSPVIHQQGCLAATGARRWRQWATE